MHNHFEICKKKTFNSFNELLIFLTLSEFSMTEHAQIHFQYLSNNDK